MFCPRCSQEQISEEIKYCSRCGFLLIDVAEALNNEGRVERNVIHSAKDLKRATLGGVGVMTFGVIFVLLTLYFWTNEPMDLIEFKLLVGLFLFIFGMLFIGYSFWIRPKLLERELKEESAKNLNSAKPNLLPEQDLTNMVDYASPQSNLITKDLVEVPSVTEDTTKFL